MISGRSRAVASAAIVGLFAALVSAFPVRAFRARLEAAVRSGGTAPAPFDREYLEFLREVERNTTPESTVALVVPRGELYVYEAAYRLAPRRVIFRADDPEAAVVAVYRYMRVPPPAGRPGRAIGHGLLYRR